MRRIAFSIVMALVLPASACFAAPGVGAGLQAAAGILPSYAPLGAMANHNHGYTMSYLFLDLDGAMVGSLVSVEGGHATTDVSQAKSTSGEALKEHASDTQSALTLQAGAGMSDAFFDWIQASLDHRAGHRNGAIIAADYNMQEQERITFQDAELAEVTFPACDAASRSAARITVRLAAKSIRWTQGSGKVSDTPAKSRQKVWLPNNFRLNINGLECRRVNKIEAITLHPAGHPGDLVVTLPQSDAGPWSDWLNGKGGPRDGRLEYLNPDGRAHLTLSLKRLRITQIDLGTLTAGSASAPRMKATLSCDEVGIERGSM